MLISDSSTNILLVQSFEHLFFLHQYSIFSGEHGQDISVGLSFGGGVVIVRTGVARKLFLELANKVRTCQRVWHVW